MGRSILAVLAGVFLGVVVISTVQAIGHAVYPPPPDLDPTNVEAFKAAVANMPAGALIFVLLAWALGAFAGGGLSAWLARRSHMLHALIAGAVLLVNGIISLVMIPHPLWVTVAGVLVFLPAAYVGSRLVPHRQAA
jgi:hypothetical protein